MQPPVELMGVLNVTPDSFSDGGRWSAPDDALQRAERLAEEGADWIDVGGESTRPGADPVSLEDELERVVPVVRALCERLSVRISVDTTKAEVARRALDAGATMVNDISAGTFDPQMLPVLARSDARFALMHMRGVPRTMQSAPQYTDVVAEVGAYLEERATACAGAGIDRSRLLFDPGIGFGKTLDHNLELLRRLRELVELGPPLLLGVSRKSFLAHAEERAGRPAAPPDERVGGTAAAVTLGVLAGARVLRVHDVATMGQAARIAALFRPGDDTPATRRS